MKMSPMIFACLLLTSPSVFAQMPIQTQDITQQPIRYPALGSGDTTPGTPSLPQDLELTVAVGAGVQPDYMGSDDYEAVFEPALNLDYKQRGFLVINREAMMTPYEGLGIKMIATQDASAGFNLTYDPGRDDDNSFITGIGEMDWTALGGVFAAYHPGPFFLRGQLGRDLLDVHESFKGEVGAGVVMPFARSWRGMVDLTSSFAGEGYVDDYFSVAPGTASGLPAYNADGGFYKWRLAGALQYQLTPGAFVETVLRYDQLTGDAADSPIVRDAGALSLSGLVGYRF